MNKNRMRFILAGAVIVIGVALVAVNPLSYNGGNSQNGTTNGNNVSGTGNTTSTKAGPNILDNAGIIGAAVLGIQVPWGGTVEQQTKFADNVTASLNKVKVVGGLDVGLNGNQIVESDYTPGGLTACFAVTTGTLSGKDATGQAVSHAPYQADWVIYIDHSAKKPADYFAFVKQGVTTCAEAKQVDGLAKTVTEKRLLVSNTDNALKNSLSVLPFSSLTKGGLYIADVIRGVLTVPAYNSSNTVASPVPSPTVTKKARKK